MTTGIKLTTGSGNKFKLYIAGLAPGQTTPPSIDSETVTLSGAVAQGATSITLTTSISEFLSRGSVLDFADGSVQKPVIVAADALAGTTTITINPSPHTTIGDTSTADAVYKLLVTGTTDFSADLSSDVTSSTTHADDLGFQNSVVTTQNFTIPITANFLADDAATNILENVGQNAVNEEIYYWLEEAPPQFYNIGKTTEGRAIVADFSKAIPAADIVTWTATLQTQGAPIITLPMNTP